MKLLKQTIQICSAAGWSVRSIWRAKNASGAGEVWAGIARAARSSELPVTPARFEPALNLLQSGRINVIDMISEVMPLALARRAFARAAEPGVLKVLLT